jgi:hypothetical protein
MTHEKLRAGSRSRPVAWGLSVSNVQGCIPTSRDEWQLERAGAYMLKMFDTA